MRTVPVSLLIYERSLDSDVLCHMEEYKYGEMENDAEKIVQSRKYDYIKGVRQ